MVFCPNHHRQSKTNRGQSPTPSSGPQLVPQNRPSLEGGGGQRSPTSSAPVTKNRDPPEPQHPSRSAVQSAIIKNCATTQTAGRPHSRLPRHLRHRHTCARIIPPRLPSKQLIHCATKLFPTATAANVFSGARRLWPAAEPVRSDLYDRWQHRLEPAADNRPADSGPPAGPALTISNILPRAVGSTEPINLC